MGNTCCRGNECSGQEICSYELDGQDRFGRKRDLNAAAARNGQNIVASDRKQPTQDVIQSKVPAGAVTNGGGGGISNV